MYLILNQDSKTSVSFTSYWIRKRYFVNPYIVNLFPTSFLITYNEKQLIKLFSQKRELSAPNARQKTINPAMHKILLPRRCDSRIRTHWRKPPSHLSSYVLLLTTLSEIAFNTIPILKEVSEVTTPWNNFWWKYNRINMKIGKKKKIKNFLYFFL